MKVDRSNGDLKRIAYAKFHGTRTVGYISNGFNWILNFRCHCKLVEYPNMSLKAGHLPFRTRVCVCVSVWVGKKEWHNT